MVNKMSLYSFMNKDEVEQPKLYCDRESGLNILVREVLWDDGYGRFFE